MPSPAVEVVAKYRTCEFTTLSRDGSPQTWPVGALLLADGRFLLCTSIGLPQKAFNIRRNAKVSLLFSEPTGSARRCSARRGEHLESAAPARRLWRRRSPRANGRGIPTEICHRRARAAGGIRLRVLDAAAVVRTGLPVLLSKTVVSVYVPPLFSQSDLWLACADGVPTVINAPSPIAAAARAVGTNLVKTIVVMGINGHGQVGGSVIARKPDTTPKRTGFLSAG
jgi:hypothetical protein